MQQSPNDPRTPEIYRQLMLWLEGRLPGAKGLRLDVRVHPNTLASFAGGGGADLSSAPVERVLRFRKVATMGGGGYVELDERSNIRINYDPNWESYAKIDALLAEVDPDGKPA